MVAGALALAVVAARADRRDCRADRSRRRVGGIRVVAAGCRSRAGADRARGLGLFRLMPDGYPPRALVALLALAVAAFYVLRAAFLSWVEWVRMGTVYGSSAIAAERLFARYLAADYLFHVKRRSASLIEPMTRTSDIALRVLRRLCGQRPCRSRHHRRARDRVGRVGPADHGDHRGGGARRGARADCADPPIVGAHRRRRTELFQQQLHLLQQSVGAIKDVKVTGRQPFFEERFRDVKRELGATKQRRATAATVARLGVEATLILSMLIVVFLVMRAAIPSAHIVSVLALFAYTGFRVVPSANRIMLNVGYMREAHPWIRGMDEDMRRLKLPPARPYEHVPPMLQSTLACEDVSFRYEDAPALALDRHLLHDHARTIDRHCRSDRRRQEHAGRSVARPARADERPRDDRRPAARGPRARVAAPDRLRPAGCLPARRFAAPQYRVWHSRQCDR